MLDEDDRSLGDDYPLQPSLSKQVAQEVPQASECGVGWVYHQLGDTDGNIRLVKNFVYQQGMLLSIRNKENDEPFSATYLLSESSRGRI